MTHDHTLSYRPRAFTLIELLVVISIIALLIGILLPALSAARQTANVIKCATQLQQLSRAMAAYAADNDGYVTPLNQQFASVFGTGSGFGRDVSWDDLLGLGDYDGRGGRGAFVNGGGDFVVGGFVGDDLVEASLYQCPLDDTPRNPISGFGAQTRSYGLNYREDSPNSPTDQDTNPGVSGFAGGPDVGTGIVALRYSEITQGSSTIVLAENQSVSAGVATNVAGTFSASGGPAGVWARAVDYDPTTGDPENHAAAHERGNPVAAAADGVYETNYMFADGHTGLMSNEDTVEDKVGGMNFRRSMWDAKQ